MRRQTSDPNLPPIRGRRNCWPDRWSRSRSAQSRIDSEFEHIAEKYNVANGHLYYLTDSKLHVCSLSGENDRILAENARAFVLHGDSVYYATEDEIYSLDLKNDQKAPLCKASKASDLVIADKDLYYMVADDGLYRVRSLESVR